MLMNEEIDYIQKYMLKSGEQLDYFTADGSQIDIKIVKQTERTFRLTGLITIVSGFEENQEEVDEVLLKLKLTPTKKIQLNDNDPKTIKWLELGWILKEIRFKKDGKTTDSQCYRMGFHLYKHQQEQLCAKEEKLEKEFIKWKENSRTLAQQTTRFLSKRRQDGVQLCQMMITEISQNHISDLKENAYFPNTWSIHKTFKFLHFISAFLQLCLQKEEFDWKEIGASYYKEIGGSKEFDNYKEDFIEQLENLAQCPAALLGMNSLGKITPLYFSGQLTGKYSSHQYGPVHALTDLAISEEEYSTNDNTVWLVENRAVLTRMAAEKDFLKENNSLVICVDGHVRSSHKQCIEQLLTNSRVKQVLIWSDYDPDGLNIAKELYTTVSPFRQLSIKWITADGRIIKDWQDFEDDLHLFLKKKRMEQEQILGGAEEWRQWIHH